MQSRRTVFCTLLALALVAAIATSGGPAKAGGSQPAGKIAVICLVRDPLAYQICSLKPDGSDWKLLTRGPEKIDSTDPHFSPDGTKIAFVRGPNQGKTDTYAMNANGTGARQLTHCGNCYGEDTPTYSPDGSTIAFHRDPRTSRGGIFLMRADGRHVRQLTRETCDCYDGQPSFAPGGRRLVFTRYRNAKHLGALFTVDLGDGKPQRITPWALGAGFPDWSPNGKLIVFNSFSEDLRPGRSLNVYTVHPDGTGLHALTRANGGLELNYRPTWSPDGSLIAFTHEPNAQATPGVHGEQNVDIMRADGTEIRRITPAAGGGRTADWGR